MNPSIVIRADASSTIGTGHVMRTMTLAAELGRRGWRTRLATRDLPTGLWGVVEDAGCEHVPLEGQPDAAVAAASGAALGEVAGPTDVVLTDHYGIDAAWHRATEPWAAHRVAIDDLATAPQDVAVLLDQNLGADRDAHRRLVGRGARLLLGPRYALVRPAFAEARRARARRDGAIRRVLVFLSGSDPDDVTSRAARVVAGHGLRTDVVAGPAYTALDRLATWAAAAGPHVRIHVNTPAMPDLMASADLAIGAPGSASWERCTVGLPSILLTLASNQERGAAALAAAEAAVTIGHPDGDWERRLEAALEALLADPPRVARMAAAAAQVTDGRGTARVADALDALVGVAAGAVTGSTRMSGSRVTAGSGR